MIKFLSLQSGAARGQKERWLPYAAGRGYLQLILIQLLMPSLQTLLTPPNKRQTPLSMQQTLPNPSLCLFCRPTRSENRFLAKNLYRRLKRQIARLPVSAPSQMGKLERNAFKQLIKILHPRLLRKNEQCQHLTHINSFRTMLDADSEDFERSCERLSNAIAETNYHLQLVAMQIKHVSDSLAERRVFVGRDSVEGSRLGSEEEGSQGLGEEGGINLVRQQQNIINSSEVQGNYSPVPLMGSSLSVSSLSEAKGSHFAFLLPYPAFYHGGYPMH